eukprot:TRINITY_DN8618_c0_g1::TRINITY_DN8618_c0_g1_i1::g.318::m.318 TRINITY_DN8618_c0_g1::TRINITY_DN8618_c0_g1_i1::g.318  ORF type:complete len:342 (-),score=26.33,sp/Q9US27/LOA1_SCHPO/31.40/8e-11,Acyltransferase/PF01553.16/0.018 TRINITY_DN8618_c0_g1_i1:51-1019(-)
MEKFRSTADASTGIHPFLPSTHRTSILLKIISFPVGTGICLIRLVLLLAAYLLLCVTKFLETVLSPISTIRRILTTPLFVVITRLMLIVIGFLSLGRSTISLKRRKPQSIQIQHGDVVFCNFQSYLDILLLEYWYKHPVFALADSKGKVVPLSFIQAFKLAANNSMKLDFPARSLEQVAADAKRVSRGPVVVLAEGTTTNGKTVLAFRPVLTSQLFKTSKLHLSAIKYENPMLCYTGAGSFLWHFIRVCAQIHQSATLFELDPQELPEAVLLPPAWLEQAQGLIAQLLNVKPAKITADMKTKFLEHWRQVQSGTYARSSKDE